MTTLPETMTAIGMTAPGGPDDGLAQGFMFHYSAHTA